LQPWRKEEHLVPHPAASEVDSVEVSVVAAVHVDAVDAADAEEDERRRRHGGSP
jgi:hypothetical protein